MLETILRRTLLTLIITILCGVVFHAPLSVWLGTHFTDAQLLIKSWKEILTIVALVMLVAQVIRHQKWNVLLSDWIVRISLLFSLIHVIVLPLTWQGLLPTVAGLMIDLRFIAFFVIVYSSIKLYPRWRKPLLIASAAAAVVSVLFAVLQATVLPHDILKHIGYDKDTTIAPYLTVDRNYDYVRINGTLRGPNPVGAYAIIILAVALSALLVIPKKLRTLHKLLPWSLWLFVAAAVIVLWHSYSRSALVAGIGVAGIIIGITLLRRSPRITLASAGALMIALAAIIAINWHTPIVQNILLHENPDGGSVVSSNDDHVASLETGWSRMIHQPIGAGVGSTGSASLLGETPIIIENQYLFIAHEVGWAGLLLFVWLYGLVLYRLYVRRRDYLALGVFASGIGLALIGLLLPVWVDDTVAIVWWGLAAIALGAGSTKRKMKEEVA